MDNKLQSSQKILITVLICAVVFVFAAWGIAVLASRLMDYGSGTISSQEQTQTPLEQTQPDIPQIPENRYNAEGFYEIGGIRYYYHSGYEGIPGVDVSSYQSDINWEAAKEAGIKFAMVRVGYRGWSTGELDLDNCFREHMEGALAAGLDVGVYFFSQALTVEEAEEEARYTLEQIKDYEITCPIVFDWEEVAAEDARTNEMDMRLLTACAEAFCRTIEEAGYEAGVYFNQAYGYEQLNLYSLQDHVFWLAEYAEYPTFLYDFKIWQYTNEGKVSGIEGDVDLNIMFRKK